MRSLVWQLRRFWSHETKRTWRRSGVSFHANAHSASQLYRLKRIALKHLTIFDGLRERHYSPSTRSASLLSVHWITPVYDAHRTPGLCRYFRGHLKMKGVTSSPACRALPIKSGNRYCRCSNILAHASYHGMVDFASADGSDERGPVAAIFAATISSSPSSEAMRWRS